MRESQHSLEHTGSIRKASSLANTTEYFASHQEYEVFVKLCSGSVLATSVVAALAILASWLLRRS